MLININKDNDENTNTVMGIIIDKKNDKYKVIIDDVIYTNVRSLNKIEYNVDEKILMSFINDVYFIIGSYDKEHTGGGGQDTYTKSEIDSKLEVINSKLKDLADGIDYAIQYCIGQLNEKFNLLNDTKQDILKPDDNITGKGGTTVTKENNTIIISSNEAGGKEEFKLVNRSDDGCVKVYESQNFIQILFDGKITIDEVEGWGEPKLVYGDYKPLNSINTTISNPLVKDSTNIIYGLVNKSGNIYVSSYNSQENVTIYGQIIYSKFYK